MICKNGLIGTFVPIHHEGLSSDRGSASSVKMAEFCSSSGRSGGITTDRSRNAISPRSYFRQELQTFRIPVRYQVQLPKDPASRTIAKGHPDRPNVLHQDNPE